MVAAPTRAPSIGRSLHILVGRCGSSRSCRRPPRCCSPSASATRSPPSPTSATTRRRRSTCPQVTRDVIGPGLPPDEIDRAVRELTEQGRAIYELDEARAAAPAARPDRHAGAVRGVRRLLRRRARGRRAAGLRSPQVISLDPHTLGEVLGDVRTLAAGDRRQGRRRRPRAGRGRRGSTACGSPCAPPTPVRVAALEWLDPVFVAGHWTPQLIEYAGGIDVLGLPGEHSERRTLGGGRAPPQPEVVVVMPCGYDAERALEEADDVRRRARAELGARRVVAVDAAAYFSRPGPRLVDGLELLAHVLHPDRAARAARRAWSRDRALATARCAARPTSAAADRRSRPATDDRAHDDRGAGAASGAAVAAAAPRRAVSIASAASAPPIRPPRWPPIEMLAPGSGTPARG